MRVVICFLLLGAGRVVNLFIPLIYRNIGKRNQGMNVYIEN